MPDIEVRSRPCPNLLKHAARMQSISRRDSGVWQQTRGLLYKNTLIKWRTKQQSLQVPFIAVSPILSSYGDEVESYL